MEVEREPTERVSLTESLNASEAKEELNEENEAKTEVSGKDDDEAELSPKLVVDEAQSEPLV